LELVDIQAVAPTLAVRDRLQDAQADQILVRNQAMSVETMAARHGLSPDHEQQLIARRADVREANYNPNEPRDEKGRWTRTGSIGSLPPVDPPYPDDPYDDEDDDDTSDSDEPGDGASEEMPFGLWVAASGDTDEPGSTRPRLTLAAARRAIQRANLRTSAVLGRRTGSGEPVPEYFPNIKFSGNPSPADKLQFYAALLTLGDKGGEMGKALVSMAISEKKAINENKPLIVNIAPGHNPLVESHARRAKRTLDLPNTPNYVPPEEVRKTGEDRARAAIASEKAYPLPGEGEPARAAREERTKAGESAFLEKELKELESIYKSKKPENAAALVLGHELGHALIELRDPQPTAPHGGNVTLVENPLRRSLFRGAGGARETYNGFQVPTREQYENAQAALKSSKGAREAFATDYQRQTGQPLPAEWRPVAEAYVAEYETLVNLFRSVDVAKDYPAARQRILDVIVGMLLQGIPREQQATSGPRKEEG
jgi:hypothetical protein